MQKQVSVNLVSKDFGGSGGIHRYASSLHEGLRAIGVRVELRYVDLPLTLRRCARLLGHYGETLRQLYSVHPLRIPTTRDSITHLAHHLPATSLLWRTKGPTVVTVHDIFHYLHRRDPWLRTFGYTALHGLLDAAALRALPRADAIIAISADTKRALVEHLGVSQSKIQVVHSGVNHQAFRPQAVNGRFLQSYGLPECRYVLHVSSEEPRKNIKTLLEAFAQVRGVLRGVKLLKVGKRGYLQERTRLLQAINRLGLADDVIFLDQVSEGDLALLYSLAEVYVLPSFHEGFGLTALEAMACGTPVVCSNAGALQEVLGNAALFVAPTDSEALASAIQQLLTDSALAGELSLRGMARAQEFTWRRTARETLRVYETLSREGIG